jgi:hypothetical protein
MSNDFDEVLGEPTLEQLVSAIYAKLLELEARLKRLEQPGFGFVDHYQKK